MKIVGVWFFLKDEEKAKVRDKTGRDTRIYFGSRPTQSAAVGIVVVVTGAKTTTHKNDAMKNKNNKNKNKNSTTKKWNPGTPNETVGEVNT
jgi:hypothetical protein